MKSYNAIIIGKGMGQKEKICTWGNKKYKAEEQAKPIEKKEASKETER